MDWKLDEEDLRVLIIHVFRQVRDDLNGRDIEAKLDAQQWIRDPSDPLLRAYTILLDRELEEVWRWIGLNY